MRAAALSSLILFKLQERYRRWTDRHGGWRRAAGREAIWAESWSRRFPSAADWLERPGGGRFWVNPETARRWARRRCSAADLALARGLGKGELDFLGFTPARIGLPPQWRRDLYSGREWPAVPAGEPVRMGEGNDVRTVWELSRGYHLIPLAKAYRKTGDAGLLDLFRLHVETWLAQNPPGLGPAWWSPMDAAIRSANWMLAFILLADAPLSAGFWGRMLASIRTSAWFVKRHLEWHPTSRGNHYVANAVGLVYAGALFRDDAEGAEWLRLGSSVLDQEMRFQVLPDGVSYEASLAYHRLVTELFTFGGEIARRNLPGSLSEEYWVSLRRMYGFLQAYLPPGGEAPMLGDADDGRLHALCAEALTQPRRHLIGLPIRHAPAAAPQSSAFRSGGFYVIRNDGDHAVIRCGPLGLGGAGCHDHNDQLSLELVLAGSRLIADSGTYAYTRDLEERYAFRSTSAHSVVQIGGEEQNPIAVNRPWRVLADRTRSECTEWRMEPLAVSFTGRHFGYADRPSNTVCTRRIVADFRSREWRIEDSLTGVGTESLVWRLHLVPGRVEARREGEAWVVIHSGAPGISLRLTASPGLSFEVGHSRMSDRYGQAVERPVLVLSGTAAFPVHIATDLTPVPGSR